jgi:hypothetical protein
MRPAGERDEPGGRLGLVQLDAVPAGGFQELLADRLGAPRPWVEHQHRPVEAVDPCRREVRGGLAAGRHNLGRGGTSPTMASTGSALSAWRAPSANRHRVTRRSNKLVQTFVARR